jgi:hypothetical protein
MRRARRFWIGSFKKPFALAFVGGRRTGYPFSSPTRGGLLLVLKHLGVNALVGALALWQPQIGACERTPGRPARGRCWCSAERQLPHSKAGGGAHGRRPHLRLPQSPRSSNGVDKRVLAHQPQTPASRPENVSHAGRRTRGAGLQPATRPTKATRTTSSAIAAATCGYRSPP